MAEKSRCQYCNGGAFMDELGFLIAHVRHNRAGLEEDCPGSGEPVTPAAIEIARLRVQIERNLDESITEASGPTDEQMLNALCNMTSGERDVVLSSVWGAKRLDAIRLWMSK